MAALTKKELLHADANLSIVGNQQFHEVQQLQVNQASCILTSSQFSSEVAQWCTLYLLISVDLT